MIKSRIRRRYKINNWAEYNKALIQRGSLTIWVQEGDLQGWLAKGTPKKRGRRQIYSNDAILMLLILREVYRLPLRAMQGLAESIFCLMGMCLRVPCYTQVCRRAKTLGKILKRLPRKGKVDVVFDSTGLKVYGEGEWKVRSHGIGKRRTWKKLHVGIDPSTQEILVCELTGRDGGDAVTAVKMLGGVNGVLQQVLGDGAYDGGIFREEVERLGAELIVPPPRNATYKDAKTGWQRKRDAALAEIQGLGGDDRARALWKKLVGYHRRSLAETTMYRLKQILGGNLKSRHAANQAAEVQCKCLVLNTMASLGLPKGEWIETAA
jgi:hypothetical protein